MRIKFVSMGTLTALLFALALGAQRPAAPRILLGQLVNGGYHNLKTGVEIPLPSGWSVTGDSPSSDNGDIVMLRDANSNTRYAAVWMIKESNTPDQIREWMQIEVGAKVRQRHDQGVQNYHVRLEDVQQRQIGGHQALVYVGDYLDRGEAMSEYMTNIYTSNTRVFFFGRIPTAELGILQARFDQLINAALIP